MSLRSCGLPLKVTRHDEAANWRTARTSGVLEADFGEGCTDQPRNLPAIVPLELALVDDDQNHERKYDDHEPHIRMPFAASERSPYRRNLIFGQGPSSRRLLSQGKQHRNPR